MIASSFRVALGDLPTWLLAVFALGALIAAGLAYRKQSASDRHLAEQVRLQGEALSDQQNVNSLQARVLERTLDAFLRQQAEKISVHSSVWRGQMPGHNSESGRFHEARVLNESPRPIRNAVCRFQTSRGGDFFPAQLTGPMATVEFNAGAITRKILVDPAEDDKIRLLMAGQTAAFVFPSDAQDGQAILTLRFTDDAGLHWQVDGDEHLELLDSRDW